MSTHKVVEPEDMETEEMDVDELKEGENPKWRKQINVTVSREVVHAARELGKMEHRSLSNTVEFALALYVKIRTQQVRQEREGLLKPQIPPTVPMSRMNAMSESEVKMAGPVTESVEG